MRFPQSAVLLLALAAATLSFAGRPQNASAQSPSFFHKTYKVEVEYWFFDTDYYYWGVVFESSSLAEAQLMYELLLLAKENGQLNQVAGASYGRYIALDVRMVTIYHLPEFQQAWYAEVTPVQSAKLIRAK